MKKLKEKYQFLLKKVKEKIKHTKEKINERLKKLIMDNKFLKALAKKLNIDIHTLKGKGKAFVYLIAIAFSFITITILINIIFGISLVFLWIIDMLFLIAIVVCMYFIFKYIETFSEPLEKLIVVSENIAKGDLTQRTGIIREDELGKVAKTFDEMIHSIEDIINNIQYSSERTITGTKKLSKISTSAKESSVQIVEAMNEIAKGTEYQVRINEDIRDNVINLMDLSVDLATKNNEIEEKANLTTNTIHNSQHDFSELINSVNQLSSSAHETDSKVKDFEKMIKQISTITEKSNHITSQTKLLALNAAIQAAHAGEYGVVFSTVAQEVKNLSDQSYQSSKEIEEIVDVIKKSISEISEQTKESIQYADYGKETAEKAKVSIFSIIEDMKKVVEAVEGMKELMLQQRESVEKIDEQMTESTAISNQTSASTEEVYATSVNFEKQMETITKMAEKLAEISSELKKSTEKFQVENVGFYL